MRKLLALVCVVIALAAGLFVLGVYLLEQLTPSDIPGVQQPAGARGTEAPR